jgi:hypothetical protein
MLKRLLLALVLVNAIVAGYGCVPLAAGTAGAVIGHEAAEDDDD